MANDECNEYEIADMGTLQPGSGLLGNLNPDYFSWAGYIDGLMMVSKPGEQAQNTVRCFMLLLRMPQFTTDLLVVFYSTTEVAPGGSVAAHIKHVVPAEEATQTINQILSSLTVRSVQAFVEASGGNE